jgi:hypothetical protein
MPATTTTAAISHVGSDAGAGSALGAGSAVAAREGRRRDTKKNYPPLSHQAIAGYMISPRLTRLYGVPHMPSLIPRGSRLPAVHRSVILVAVVLSAFFVASIHSSRTVHASTVLQAGQAGLTAPPADNTGRLMVLLFDTTALPQDQLDNAVSTSLAFVDKDMAAADRVAIVTISPRLGVVSDFTSDRDALHDALSASRLQSGVQNGAAVPTAAAAAAAPSDERLRALTTLCTTLAPLTQRKSLLYFSGGLTGAGADNQTELNTTTNTCRRANVLIFPVDARGLAAVAGSGRSGGVNRFNGRPTVQ